MRSPRPFNVFLIALGVLAAALAYYFTLPTSSPATIFRSTLRTASRTSATATASTSLKASASSSARNMSAPEAASGGPYARGQVYFLSHGGPPTMFETTSAPYKAWQKYGKEVTKTAPRGLVVVSAHWENPDRSSGVVVNVDESNPLVYDFYGFPANYYKQTFKSRGDPALLGAVKEALTKGGIPNTTERRGLDHGVWVPFLVAFNGETRIPIVQVSLPGDSSPISAAKLGRALAPLREQGYGIFGTGMAVHNLRDYMYGQKGSYGKPFLSAVNDAVHSPDPAASSINLFRHPLYRAAHPTPEHLLPLVVSAAAADEGDKVKDLFVEPDGSMGWGMWMWQPKKGSSEPEAPAA